jgi:predicted dehydrogenase
MVSNRIRLGIIGAGGMAKVGHIPALRQIPEMELVALCRRNKQELDKLAREYGIGECYTDYRDMVKSKNIDAVIVVTPNAQHRDSVVAAAEEGKHILCDKPLATNLKDAREMVEICHRNHVKLQVGYHMRFYNQTEICKQLIDQRAIGEVKGFAATLREKAGLFPAVSDFRLHFEQSGGACINDLVVHHIDLARHLVGEITSVYAKVKHSVLPQKIDDDVWLLCDFGSRATGIISADRYSPVAASSVGIFGTEGTMYLSIMTVNPFESVPLAIYTEKAVDEIPGIVLKYFYSTFWWDKPGKSWISIVPPKDNAYVKQLKAFYRSILQDIEPPVIGEDGIKATEVVMAAFKSARERRPVELPIKEEMIEPSLFD